MIFIARDLYQSKYIPDSWSPPEALNYFKEKEESTKNIEFIDPIDVGKNKSRFALCVTDTKDLHKGIMFKMDLKKRDEFIVDEITDLEFYGDKIIICKRVDSNNPINTELFKRKSELYLMAEFIFDDTVDLEELLLPLPTKNTIQEIIACANTKE